jgi:predicted O-methyltransferase YrrM
MIAFGRHFRGAQLAKAVSVVSAAASPLLLRALRSGPQAAFEFSARAREICNELTERDPITTVTLNELAGNQGAGCDIWLDLGTPSGEMPAGELACLCGLARLRRPRCVVEIGTARGWTTQHLARNTPEDCRIFTVDLPANGRTASAADYSDPHLVKAAWDRQCNFEAEPKITQILHDSTTIEWSKLLDRPVDFALIDGSHLYEHVRADTERLWSVLAPSAVVLWHDYSTVEVRRGVRKYLLELHGEGVPIRRLAGTHFGAYTCANSAAAPVSPSRQTNTSQPPNRNRTPAAKGEQCWS